MDPVLNDDGDELTPDERRALDAAISQSWDEAKAGRVRSAAEVVQGIRAGLDSMRRGEGRPATEAFDELRRKHNIPRDV